MSCVDVRVFCRAIQYDFGAVILDAWVPGSTLQSGSPGTRRNRVISEGAPRRFGGPQ
jgi:hypothetical protein